MVAGRRAANCFIDTYGEVSSIQVPDERKREIHKEIKEHQVQPNPPDYMNIPFNARELEDALKALKDKKSPGPDKITNEMLKDMGPKANFQDKCHTLAVWVDMEKAFYRVWKDGLRLKLHKSGISGCMYEWISQYLNNTTARTHVNGAHSRQKTLREGVPQGGVLSPTLFLIYVNDIIAELPRKIHSALYADDMVLRCSEEYITTDNYRMQQALEVGLRNGQLKSIPPRPHKTSSVSPQKNRR